MLILDGLDEMKYGMSRDALNHNLNEINRLSTGASKIILCGRPTLFADTRTGTPFLQGATEASIISKVYYLPISVAPIQRDRIVPLASAYAKSHARELDIDISFRLTELKRAMRRGSTLSELLSRPVHIPMLIGVLPELNRGALTNLNRGDLYLHFIRMTIERESRKSDAWLDRLSHQSSVSTLLHASRARWRNKETRGQFPLHLSRMACLSCIDTRVGRWRRPRLICVQRASLSRSPRTSFTSGISLTASSSLRYTFVTGCATTRDQTILRRFLT